MPNKIANVKPKQWKGPPQSSSKLQNEIANGKWRNPVRGPLCMPNKIAKVKPKTVEGGPPNQAGNCKGKTE